MAEAGPGRLRLRLTGSIFGGGGRGIDCVALRGGEGVHSSVAKQSGRKILRLDFLLTIVPAPMDEDNTK